MPREWPARVIVTHNLEGCATGCCGWEVCEPDGHRRGFDFGHLGLRGECREQEEPLDDEVRADIIARARRVFEIPPTTEVELGPWLRCWE